MVSSRKYSLAQTLQLLAAVIDHRPVPQAVHEVAPLSLTLPASHEVHVDSPASAAIVPAAHVVQADAPVAAAIVPARQAVHPLDPSLAAILPASQALQSSMLSWKLARFPLSLRNLPLGHWLQLLEPLLGM
jgi:hypothetical protein